MTKKRVFKKQDVERKAEDYCGGAGFTRALPDLYAKGIKSLNLEVPFDEGMKLSLALQACLQSLNRYNRGTKKGKAMGVLLSIKKDNSSITVIEKLLPSRSE